MTIESSDPRWDDATQLMEEVLEAVEEDGLEDLVGYLVKADPAPEPLDLEEAGDRRYAERLHRRLRHLVDRVEVEPVGLYATDDGALELLVEGPDPSGMPGDTVDITWRMVRTDEGLRLESIS